MQAAPPDWLTQTLAQPPTLRNANLPAVYLLNAREVRYLAADHARARWYGAVKILTPAGLTLAPVAMGYTAGTDQVVSAHAWVISADGRKIKAFGQSGFTDLARQNNSYFWDATRVLAFEGGGRTEVGGVLAWDIEVDSPSGVLSSSWNFTSNLDVLHGRFEVVPPPGGTLQWHASSERLGPPVAGREAGALRWEISDQLPYSTGRPLGFIPNPRAVAVRCIPAPGGGGWAELGRLAGGVIEPRMDPTGPVKARAEAIIAGHQERWERIRALTEFTQRDIVYLEITLDQDYLAGYRPHPAAEVLRNRYGDCKDKATLLVSMLRSIGEEAYVVLLNAGNPTTTAREWPSLLFNHAIVALRSDARTPEPWPVVDAGALGKLVVFDPTDSTTPLGVLAAPDQGGYALVLAPGGGQLVRLPVAGPAANRVERKITARVGPRGELSASVTEDLHGRSGAEIQAMRFVLGPTRFKQRLEARVHQATPLAQKLEWLGQWDPAAAQFRLTFDFESDRFARQMGEEMMMITPRILAETTALLPWQTRAEGIVWLPSGAWDEEVRITLPAGFAVEEMPDEWAQRAGQSTGSVTYRAEGGDVVYHGRLSRAGGFYGRADYEALRAFEDRVSQAQRRPLLLRRRPASPPPPPAGS